MRLKLYRAASVPEAMAQVRAELGGDALILNTRRWYDGVELTAALEPAATVAPPDRGHAEALAFHAVPPALRLKLGAGDLSAALKRCVVFAPLPVETAPLLFVGPPGAGKTLTVVRLATRLTLAGRTPAVISTDDAKAGANEQLLAFTRLLGVPLTEANDAVSLSRATARRRDVLIDTQGTDPFDEAHIDLLRTFATAAGATIALVLPAGLDPEEAADLARAYASAGASLLIVTRLDMARRLGSVLAAAEAANLPLAEAGVGPGAADGLVPMTAQLLAERLLRTGNLRHAA
jgi:flagellar biosynthesis protein FlhF